VKLFLVKKKYNGTPAEVKSVKWAEPGQKNRWNRVG